tara:strand:+ start:1522 stop:1941 length:420 start_codon:yes stop_codon:yes gene_type:complete
MSRITYTKKGNPSDRKDRTLPIASAPLSIRLLWAFGNLFGFSQIKRNAKLSRGFGIESDRPVKNDDGIGYVLNPDGTVKTEKRTYTSYNFGKWVANKRNTNPSRDVWYKRTMVRGEYQFTPPSFTNTTMQMIRIPARRS